MEERCVRNVCAAQSLPGTIQKSLQTLSAIPPAIMTNSFLATTFVGTCSAGLFINQRGREDTKMRWKSLHRDVSVQHTHYRRMMLRVWLKSLEWQQGSITTLWPKYNLDFAEYMSSNLNLLLEPKVHALKGFTSTVGIVQHLLHSNPYAILHRAFP